MQPAAGTPGGGEEEEGGEEGPEGSRPPPPLPPPLSLPFSLLLPVTNPRSSTARPHCSTANCLAALGRYLSGSVTHSSFRLSSAPRTRRATSEPPGRASLATAAADTNAAPRPASTAPLIASTELTSSTTGSDRQSSPAASRRARMAWTVDDLCRETKRSEGSCETSMEPRVATARELPPPPPPLLLPFFSSSSFCCCCCSFAALLAASCPGGRISTTSSSAYSSTLRSFARSAGTSPPTSAISASPRATAAQQRRVFSTASCRATPGCALLNSPMSLGRK